MSLTQAIAHPSADRAPSLEPLEQLLWAAGDSLRLSVLQVLGQSSFGVLELCEICDMRQPAMSHHLKVLAEAGLVERRREGNAIWYSRSLASDALHQALLDRIDEVPPDGELAGRLAQVQARRAEHSRVWFERYAGEAGQEELIAAYEDYADLALELALRSVPEGELAIEIGPGDGAFMQALSGRFRRLIGYENAPAQLARAERQLADAKVQNATLILGEWPAAAPDEAEADLVVLNMVLHHMPAPADSLRAAARRLKPGGTLLVTELCRHEEHRAHDTCGDLWLGFEEQELLAWAKRAGLEQNEVQYLAQRNGFQVQVRTFERSGEK
ncbi:MAG: metalloregulator ArsR/SmtB family transcription factor [Alcanivoracaceae bacterium]|jgi:ArsR family transcriptional regulator|nr:metalloregulator ArsR/SmtB family transcription factor [Alcanivoracaceae bacterium]